MTSVFGNPMPSDDGVAQRAIEAMERTVRQLVCGMNGHAYLLRFEPTRLCLECCECGQVTPGIDVTPKDLVRQ